MPIQREMTIPKKRVVAKILQGVRALVFVRHQEKKEMEHLPDSVLLKIFESLDVRQILRIAIVNRKFFRVSEDPALWKHMFIRDFKLSNHRHLQLQSRDWLSEYRDLTAGCPKFLSQTVIREPCEFTPCFDLCFSNSGDVLAQKVGNPEDGFNTFDIFLWKREAQNLESRFSIQKLIRRIERVSSHPRLTFCEDDEKLLAESHTLLVLTENSQEREGYWCLSDFAIEIVKNRFKLVLDTVQQSFGRTFMKMFILGLDEPSPEPENGYTTSYPNTIRNIDLGRVTVFDIATSTFVPENILRRFDGNSNEGRHFLWIILGIRNDQRLAGANKLCFWLVSVNATHSNTPELMVCQNEHMWTNTVDAQGCLRGLAVSPCQRFLYLNVQPEIDHYSTFRGVYSENMQIRIFDFEKFELLKKNENLSGHKYPGDSRTNGRNSRKHCFDISKKWILSSSADHHICIFSRIYECLVAKIRLEGDFRIGVIDKNSDKLIATLSGDQSYSRLQFWKAGL